MYKIPRAKPVTLDQQGRILSNAAPLWDAPSPSVTGGIFDAFPAVEWPVEQEPQWSIDARRAGHIVTFFDVASWLSAAVAVVIFIYEYNVKNDYYLPLAFALLFAPMVWGFFRDLWVNVANYRPAPPAPPPPPENPYAEPENYGNAALSSEADLSRVLGGGGAVHVPHASHDRRNFPR